MARVQPILRRMLSAMRQGSKWFMATPWQPAAVALVHRVPSPLVDALRRAVLTSQREAGQPVANAKRS